MKQNKSTFEFENLVVDWISFKFQDLQNSKKTKIAVYLFKLGFNSYQQSGKLAKPIKQSILFDPINKFEVCFVVDNSHWQGSLIQFSGSNAKIFYALIKQKLIDWRFFSDSVLGRFDIYFSRRNKKSDNLLVTDFFESCQRTVQQTNKNVNFEKNNKGLILGIGNRKSNHYSRIYQTKNSLRFEYEMKGQFIRKYHPLLVEDRFEEFELIIWKQFLYHFGKTLPLHYSYLDWLVVKLRPIRKQKLSSITLKTDYIRTIDFQSFNKRQKFFTLLQFLGYAQNLDYDVGFLGSTYYRRVRFRIHDFLKYKKVSDNFYQLKKLVIFFYELQTNSLIQFFSDTHFRSLVTIPEVNLDKDKPNGWIAEVWIAEELFYYAHPFLFPDLVKRKLRKYQFEVQFKIIQVFCSVEVEKTFLIKEFFQNYPSTLTNKQKTEIKEYFIELIKVFEKHQLIESNYKIIRDGKIYQTEQLTARDISEGFIVYEKLFI